MKKRNWKRIALTSLCVFVLLVGVLAVHIYMVTRPRIDANSRVMARIDIRQTIGKADADKITAWLYQQPGVDHVLVNPASAQAIFTYSPMKNDANKIAGDLRTDLAYNKAERYMPSEKEMAAGCPVMAGSVTYKVYSFFKNVF